MDVIDFHRCTTYVIIGSAGRPQSIQPLPTFFDTMATADADYGVGDSEEETNNDATSRGRSQTRRSPTSPPPGNHSPSAFLPDADEATAQADLAIAQADAATATDQAAAAAEAGAEAAAAAEEALTTLSQTVGTHSTVVYVPELGVGTDVDGYVQPSYVQGQVFSSAAANSFAADETLRRRGAHRHERGGRDAHCHHGCRWVLQPECYSGRLDSDRQRGDTARWRGARTGQCLHGCGGALWRVRRERERGAL